MIRNDAIDNKGNTDRAGIPSQKLTKSEKIQMYGSVERWGLQCIDAIENSLGFSYSARLDSINDKMNMQRNLLLIEEGIYDTSHFDDIEKPFGEDKEVKFPVELKHYDMISSTTEVILGEELSKPFDWIVVNKSSESADKFNKAKNDLVNQYMMQQIMIEEAKMAKARGIPSMFSEEAINDPEVAKIATPDGRILKSINDIEFYAKSTFSDVSEITANQILSYIEKDEMLKFKLHQGFKKYLAVAQEIYHVSEVGGDLKVRLVNPLLFDCILSSEEMLVENASYCREIRYLTKGEIIDEFYDSLTPAEVALIDKSDNFDLNWGDTPMSYSFNNGIVSGIRVAKIEWKSMKKIGLTEDGEIVDETYKPSKKENIKWTWITERWEGTRIRSDIYVNIRPLEKQYRSIDNISDTKSSYVGIVNKYSLVDKLINYQNLYNKIMFRLNLCFQKMKGKVGIIDIAQIPKTNGWTTERWMHALDVYGLIFINSLELSEDDQRSNFNTYQTYDMSNISDIQACMEILNWIDAVSGKTSGVTDQRKGNIKNSETVGGVERSVMQSSAITESIFFIHSVVTERLLQRIIDVAKSVYKKGKKGMAILSDYSRASFEVTDDNFQYADIGVFVSNSSTDRNKLEQVRQAVSRLYENGALSLQDLIRVIKTNSLSELETIAEISVQKMEDLRKEESQNQQNMQNAQLQSNQQIEQSKIEIENQRLQLEKYKAELQAQTTIEAAKIKAEAEIISRRDDINADQNNNGVLDVLENKKLVLEQDKLEFEKSKHKDEVKLKEKEIEAKAKDKSKKP